MLDRIKELQGKNRILNARLKELEANEAALVDEVEGATAPRVDCLVSEEGSSPGVGSRKGRRKGPEEFLRAVSTALAGASPSFARSLTPSSPSFVLRARRLSNQLHHVGEEDSNGNRHGGGMVLLRPPCPLAA